MRAATCVNGWGVSSMMSFQLGVGSSVIKCCLPYLLVLVLVDVGLMKQSFKCPTVYTCSAFS